MNYRDRRNYLNQQKRMFNGVGKYGIPYIHSCDITLSDRDIYVPFNKAMATNNKDKKICHFFIDDYQFERVWIYPDRYIDLLSQFKAITTPDFSLYRDFPVAVQIFNHFRKHWLGAYYQELGMNVIPIVRWSTEDTFEWCFDGVPKNAIIATGSIGCFSDEEGKRLFDAGWNAMIDALEPSEILLYSNNSKYESSLNNCYYAQPRVRGIRNDVIKRLRTLC